MDKETIKMDEETIIKDLKKLISVFDNFLDDMYDCGAFDVTQKKDRDINDFLEKMVDKYGSL